MVAPIHSPSVCGASSDAGSGFLFATAFPPFPALVLMIAGCLKHANDFRSSLGEQHSQLGRCCSQLGELAAGDLALYSVLLA
jgi:hypothetical protein